MQTMVEFGFDAADIAYATGQSAQAVGDYLTLNGAPAGFAGAVTVGQRASDAAYLQALDAALAHPVYAQLRRDAPGSDTISLLGTVTQSSPSDTPWWTRFEVNNYDDRRQWASFDIHKFNRWYLTQATPDTQAFVRLHGPDLSPSGFSLSGAQLTLGGWVTQQRGQNEIVVWQPSHIRWAQSEPGTQI